MTDHAAGQHLPEKKPLHLVLTVAIWVLAAVAAGAGLFVLLGRLDSGHWWPWSGRSPKPDAYDLFKSAAALVALIGAIVAATVAAAVAMRRQRAAERSIAIAAEALRVLTQAQLVAARAQEVGARAQEIGAGAYQLDLRRNQRDAVRDLRGRFAVATGQLGDPVASTRLAGAYAMAALADDWAAATADGDSRAPAGADTQVCIDVLCAYLRVGRRAGDEHDRRAEIVVRHTILSLIAAHLRPGLARRLSWSGRTIDLSGATFADGAAIDFSEVTLGGGGRINFAGATFGEGGGVSFYGATFGEDSAVIFTRASFASRSGVGFNRATLAQHSRLGFEWARFAERSYLDFDGARLADNSSVDFTRATFAEFSAIDLNRATFAENSRVGFDGATYAGRRILQRRRLSLDWPPELEPISTVTGEFSSFSALSSAGEHSTLGGLPPVDLPPARLPSYDL
ncbi:MAG: hypothetical protein LBQ06_07330 [Frankiaceae bacterium]|nr:hypothetical protein [Frankiaceae bacterium]